MKKLQYTLLIISLYTAACGQNCEKWFINSMANQPIGFVKESISVQTDKIITGMNTKLIFNRKGSRIEMFFTTETTENNNGEFISATGNVKTTGQDITLQGLIVNDSIEITMSTGGQTYKSKIAVKEKLIGPGAVRKKSMNGLKQIGDSINYSMFAPDQGIIGHFTRKLLAIENIVIGNSDKTFYKIQESFKESPLAKEIWIDKNYDLVKMLDPSPFGSVESIISAKQLAETAGEQTVLPSESFEKTVLRSNVRFTDPRNLEQVVFKITLTNKSLKFPGLAATHQKIIEQGKDYVILQYTRPVLPLIGNNKTADLSDFLAPNTLITSDDPDIIKIANEVTRNKKTDFEKAVALKNWVSANVKGDFGIALASGSEVCKIRKGTCMAFSTFFSSLLRAAKVPARFLVSYVYMNGIWGGHAWVEIYANGIWIPMDATISVTDIADAARFSFGEGWSFKSGVSEFLLSEGTVLYGNSDVKVLSYVINGKKIIVPELAKTFTIENNTYINPGKKIRISKMPEFDFKNLDEVWPSECFATLTFTDGEVKIMDGYWKAPWTKEEAIRKEMESVSGSKMKSTINFNGSKIYVLNDPLKAFYTVIRGKDLMLFYANGSNPVNMLKKVLTNTKFE